LVNKQILIARELTKRFEHLVISPISAVVEAKDVGEFTVVVSETSGESELGAENGDQAADLVGRLTDTTAFERDEAVLIASKVTGATAREILKVLKKRKILANQQNRQ
jgi:16S rRNA C1402 (ribose-2'-O) methylase RsmI